MVGDFLLKMLSEIDFFNLNVRINVNISMTRHFFNKTSGLCIAYLYSFMSTEYISFDT